MPKKKPTPKRAAPKPTRQDKSETIHYLTPDELKRLFAAIESKRDKAIFITAYRYGLRASEVGQLNVTDVDFKTQRIRIRRVKGSRGGDYPLWPDVARAIKSHLRDRKLQDSPALFPSNFGTPISTRMLDVLMKAYGADAKLPEDKRHFHTLKHSIATHLAAAGADPLFIQSWLGHANIQNTMIYTTLISTTRDEKARSLFPKLPKL